MKDVFILGDVGGQAEVFRDVVRGFCGSGWVLPENVVLLQVGDIARIPSHGGLDNDTTIRISEELLLANGDNYIQLLGNHDLGLIGGALGRHHGIQLNQTLKNLWMKRRVQLAVAIRQSEEWYFVSHAGLTVAAWKELGSPSAQDATAMINSRVGTSVRDFERPGRLFTGKIFEAPDVTWAEVNDEFYGPWIDFGGPPFGFIHGHASPFSWRHSDWWEGTPQIVRERTTVFSEARRTETVLSQPAGIPRKAISVDWALGDSPVKNENWPILHLQGVEQIVLNSADRK